MPRRRLPELTTYISLGKTALLSARLRPKAGNLESITYVGFLDELRELVLDFIVAAMENEIGAALSPRGPRSWGSFGSPNWLRGHEHEVAAAKKGCVPANQASPTAKTSSTDA